MADLRMNNRLPEVTVTISVRVGDLAAFRDWLAIQTVPGPVAGLLLERCEAALKRARSHARMAGRPTAGG